MDRQDDNIKPAITDLFTVIHELWYVSTITIHSAYHTFCTATFWYCLSDKGLESFNTGLKDRPRPLESYRTSIGEKEKKRKLEMLSRQKVELFISDYTKKRFIMFESKALHPPDDCLTEINTQTHSLFQQ